jgi:glucosamine--fructose-6-phosphate aminotransferase (isomerizing)
MADKNAIDEIKADIDDSMVIYFIELPESEFFVYPLIAVIPLQFLAHFVATGLGRNVDKPRNLAKSVTVE